MVDTLYIDSNEPNNVRVAVSTTVHDRQSNADIETKRLKTGDFIYKDVVIERKEASDLASSIKDGRLKEQTMRMSEDFQHQYIIVEGNPYQLKYSNLHDNAFIGTMVSRSYAGIGIIHTPDEQGTAYAINKLMNKHEEKGEERTLELERTNVETEDVEVAMLTCVKGVSKEKAEKILEKTTLNNMLWHLHCEKGDTQGIKDEIRQVDGIGKILANRIINAFT